MKKIVLLLVFFSITYTSVAQYDTIPKSQIPAKIEEIKNGTLKDSIFWSCIGLFEMMEYKIASIYNYKIYIGVDGIYFELGFKDEHSNISLSGVYFTPHHRHEEPEYIDSDYVWLPNEHFCRCLAEVGYAIVQKLDDSFTCIGALPEYDIDDNLDIACQDAEKKEVFFRKYYEYGYSKKNRFKIIEPEVLPF
ncbi:MAG: hypothetical protein FWG85_04315 [Bacteroidetes bacterium]|nr:hypothetical protein [Bacteroidota bacterium]